MNKIIQFTLRNRLLMLTLGVLVMAAGYQCGTHPFHLQLWSLRSQHLL